MGGDGSRLEVDGDGPLRLDLDVRLAGREFQAEVGGEGPVQGLLDRGPGEVEPDARSVGLGLAAGVVVDLHDDVGLAGERAADPLGEAARLVAGGPAAEVAVDLHARSREARVAQPRVVRVLLPPFAAGVHVAEDVVDHLAVARLVLDGRDVDVLGEVGGDHEAAVDVVAGGGDREALGGLDHEVGGPELPAFGERGGRRGRRGIALRASPPRPMRPAWRSRPGRANGRA